MPLERVSKGFKDLSMSFQVNPLNYDLIAIKNETAIARSIRNLVFTLPGERFFNENLGSRVSRVLFENIDEITASVLKDEIKSTIIYSPAWTTDWLSEEAKLKLQNYGIAPPEETTSDKSFLTNSKKNITCPRCKNKNTVMISQFGSTACKALYQCKECLEAFDYFKCI